MATAPSPRISGFRLIGLEAGLSLDRFYDRLADEIEAGADHGVLQEPFFSKTDPRSSIMEGYRAAFEKGIILSA